MPRQLLSAKKVASAALFIAGMVSYQFAKAGDIQVTDNGSGIGTTTWTSDNVYHLNGFCFVNEGQTLTIEPGTVIKGMPGQGAAAAALIVARGGKIDAEGSANHPIIFTYEGDPLDGSEDIMTRGQWGGVILLGKGKLNSSPGQTSIEGIPSTEPRGLYGGNDDADNSGILKYVSIRHGGTDIGAGNEINGLTLGAVGSETYIDYIEVVSNADDGIEMFGGAPRVRHFISAFCSDDGFDYDEGFHGKGQFWLDIQAPGEGDRGGEHDGGTDPEDGSPYATPSISNVTYFGNGDASHRAITFRDNAGGHYWNSIFYNFGKWIDVENLSSGEDAYNRFSQGELTLKGLVFQTTNNSCATPTEGASDMFKISMGPGGWSSASDSTTQLQNSSAALQATFDSNDNMVANTGITYDNGTVNPIPNHNYTAKLMPNDSWFLPAYYKGAFEPGVTSWATGWTMLSQRGYLIDNTTESGQVVHISDNGNGIGNAIWTRNNTYVLDNFCFVNDGQCLTIEPGTVIKGGPGSGANASALIDARGGKLYAEGNASAPIIFTFEGDPLDGSVDPFTRGQWGGVIILGKAKLNSSPGETSIEGIPSTEPRGLYGGTDDNDNSGALTYVSIRHGGTDIGAGNEINGLTLGAVGSQTLIDHIEIFSTVDDGIEMFGGAPQVRHFATAFEGDDGFDYDEGFHGKGQFWFAVQAPGYGDRGGEHDGGTDPEDGMPYAIPTITNATYIGQGTSAPNRAITFRDNAGGFYWNSIFANWGKGIDVENLSTGEDSYNRFSQGDLALKNNLFYNDVAEGTTASSQDLFKISMGPGGWSSASDSTNQLNSSSQAVQNSFDSNNNMVGDPGISWTISQSGGLWPVPSGNYSVSSGPTDSWFQQVDYRGAFDPSSNSTWLAGWSALYEYGYIDATSGIRDQPEVHKDALHLYPNPTTGQFFVLADHSMNNVSVSIYNLVGQQVLSKSGISLSAGGYEQFDISSLPAGMYVVTVKAGQIVSTARLVKK